MFTTGQPLAVSDVAADPRFDRSAAVGTGYVPRSILAVPLIDDGGTLGVLEVLDRRGEGGFGLRDLELASVFARQATVAIRSSRVDRDAGELLRSTLAALGADDAEAVEAAVAAAVARLDDGDEDGLWALADAVARARAAAPGEVALVVEILDALARRPARAPRRGRSAGEPDLPAWSEPFAERSPGRPRPPWAVGPRRPRLGVRRRRAVAACGSRSWTPGWSGPPGGRRAPGARASSSSASARLASSPTAADGPRGARDGVRRDRPRARARGGDRLRSASSAATTGATAAGSRPGWPGRSRNPAPRSSNLSLSSRSDAFFGPLHELADEAYFRNVLLVSAANNVAVASYPSLYAAVVSVAAHDVPSAETWFYNPEPPVEFGAHGLDVDVAWRGGSRMTVTGNSFAAPHIAGLAARIRAAHPGITPFEIKTLLAATADNAT